MRELPLAFLTMLLAACSPEGEVQSTPASAETQGQDALAAVLASPLREEAARARDAYRHPAETLAFFGVEPDDLVVEMWPGGGWYTDILAPYLRAEGSLALVAPEKSLTRVRARAAAHPVEYGSVLFSPMETPGGATTVPDGSADVVLTFRNVHNWAMGDEPFAEAMFAKMYAMLRPGGTLGVVDHRLPEDRPDADMKSSGYMKVSAVKALAAKAGFEYVGSSEINANPRDTADHPKGVWTLPPTLSLKDQDRERYLAIGESDRMTLKFRKPE